MINLKIDVKVPELELDLTCPNCEKVFKKKVKDLKPNKVIKCPHCSIDIKLTGDDISKIQKTLDSFSAIFK